MYEFRDGKVFLVAEEPTFIVDRYPDGSVVRLKYGDKKDIMSIAHHYINALGARVVEAPKNQDLLDKLFQNSGYFNRYYSIYLDKQDGIIVDEVYSTDDNDIYYKCSNGKEYRLDAVSDVYKMLLDDKLDSNTRDALIDNLFSDSYDTMVVFNQLCSNKELNEKIITDNLNIALGYKFIPEKFLENAYNAYKEEMLKRHNIIIESMEEFKLKVLNRYEYGYISFRDIYCSTYGENHIKIKDTSSIKSDF